MISDDLSAVQAKIREELGRRPESFITHPSELRVLQAMTSDEIASFARENGWSLVRRLGGRQFQFYNDTSERLRNEEAYRPATFF